MNKTWIKAAGIRAIKTMAQTAVGMMSLGMSAIDINWLNILSVSVVAGVVSILTSLEGLPEVTAVTTEVATVTDVTAEASTVVAATAETEE